VRSAQRRAMPLRVPCQSRVTFNRLELNRILNLYGAAWSPTAKWRDYAIDFLRDRAVFSIFRRASEVPILPHRKGSAALAQAGDLQCHLGERTDPAPGP